MNKNLENKLTLTLISLFALTITLVCIYLNSTHNILGHYYRDVFFYLIESLKFSGVEITGYDYVNRLPPLIPFLTSLLFRSGFVGESSIFIVSGAFYFLGILGMFYLSKLRFNNFYSFFAAFIYATLFINLHWVGNGTLDIASVALMIWALYFFIRAIDENQKYFYLSFPLVVLSFFTKYTGALVVVVMALYFMYRGDIEKYFKNILGGVASGVLTSIPFFMYYFIYNIPLGFISQAEEVSSRTSLTTTHGGELIGNDLFFYIRGLIYDIGSTDYWIGIIILTITIIGLCIMIHIFKSNLKSSYHKIKNINVYKWVLSAKSLYSILMLSIIIILVSFLTAGLFSFIYSELMLFIGLFLFAYTLNKIDKDSNDYPFLAINIAMIGLFLVYFVFFSAHLTKADRYFTAMAPGFAYIMTLSLEILLSKIKTGRKYLIPAVMIIIMLVGAVNYLSLEKDDSLAISEKQASEWIKNVDGIIVSDRGPVYTWYLQKEVIYSKTDDNLNNELLEKNASYYIGTDEQELENYTKIREFNGEVFIYRLK